MMGKSGEVRIPRIEEDRKKVIAIKLCLEQQIERARNVTWNSQLVSVNCGLKRKIHRETGSVTGCRGTIRADSQKEVSAGQSFK